MADIITEVMELRGQGLTDDLINSELTKKGYKPEEISQAVGQPDAPPDMQAVQPSYSEMQAASSPHEDVYGRIEEIAESLINEKWDELISEVKKIIDWKEKTEEKQTLMASDLRKLKEDFTVLHQGVLGKLESYDERMQEVGTELKAVGKVFKDVIPEFVDNVKQLSHVTGKRKTK